MTKVAPQHWKSSITQAIPTPLPFKVFRQQYKLFEGVPSPDTLIRFFGSWNEALLYLYGEQAIQEKEGKIIPERVLLEWKSLVLNHFPQPISNRTYYLKSQSHKYLPSPHKLMQGMGGSWNAVIRFIYGEHVQLLQTQWTPELIENSLRQIFDEKGCFLTVTQYDSFQKESSNLPSVSTITRHFGSYASLMTILGQSDYQSIRKWSRTEVEAALTVYFKNPNLPKKAIEYRKYRNEIDKSLPSIKIISRYYGSWKQMLQSFEEMVEVKSSPRLTDEEVMIRFKEAIEKLTPPYTIRKYDQFRLEQPSGYYPGRPRILMCFNSWREALEKVGIQTLHQQNGIQKPQACCALLLDKKIVDRKLKMYFKNPKHTRTIRGYEAFQKTHTNYPTSQNILRYYTTWRLMLEHFDEKVFPQSPFTWNKTEIEKALRQAVKEVGVPLTTLKYDQFRKNHPKTYPSRSVILNHFPSWKEALVDCDIPVFKQRDIQAVIQGQTPKNTKIESHLLWCLS